MDSTNESAGAAPSVHGHYGVSPLSRIWRLWHGFRTFWRGDARSSTSDGHSGGSAEFDAGGTAGGQVDVPASNAANGTLSSAGHTAHARRVDGVSPGIYPVFRPGYERSVRTSEHTAEGTANATPLTVATMPARPYGPDVARLVHENRDFRLLRDQVATALHAPHGYRCNSVCGIPLDDDIREEAMLLSRNHAVNYVDAVAFCLARSAIAARRQPILPDTPVSDVEPPAIAQQPLRFSADNPLRLVLLTAMVVRGNVYTSPGILALSPYFPIVQDFVTCVRQLLHDAVGVDQSASTLRFSVNFSPRPDSASDVYTLNIMPGLEGSSRVSFTFCYSGSRNIWQFTELIQNGRTFEYPALVATLYATPPPVASPPPPPPPPPLEPEMRERRHIRLES